jgi:Arc/MetJ family transcription regulator
MRTNIEINDELLADVIKMSNAKSKKEAVEQALISYRRYLSKLALLDLRGKVKWEGDLDEMRSTR